MIQELWRNAALWVAVLAWAVAQIIKVVVDYVRCRKFHYSRFVGSGGMPSSHSSFVTALAASVGIREGFDTAMFAVASIIALVVMYDAAGVRRAAGKHAQMINLIVEAIEDSGVKLDKQLKELLGHTPLEVLAGAVLGIVVAVICVGR